MPRSHALVPPDAIRIEDEVWQEAFTRREPRSSALSSHNAAVAEAPPADTRRTSPTLAPIAVRPAPAQAGAPPAPVPALATPAAPPATGGAVARLDTVSPPRADGISPTRRTVTTRGHGAERNLPWPDTSHRRPQRRPYERAGFRPDRLAMWAVLLGILLVVVAIASAHS
jgi:hypothetical protein